MLKNIVVFAISGIFTSFSAYGKSGEKTDPDAIMGSVHQEQINVIGNVSDENGEPLPGATIVLKGDTEMYAVADIDGNYSEYLKISLASKGSDGVVVSLSDWSNFSLESLNMEGGLYGLEFSIEGSPNIAGSLGYLNTPTYAAFDNISYNLAAVPEPAEWAFAFGVAALALALYGRKR